MTKEHSLFFVRHGKLSLPYQDHGEMPFEVLVDLASGRMNPSIDIAFMGKAILELTDNLPLRDIKKNQYKPLKTLSRDRTISH